MREPSGGISTPPVLVPLHDHLIRHNAGLHYHPGMTDHAHPMQKALEQAGIDDLFHEFVQREYQSAVRTDQISGKSTTSSILRR